MAFSTLSSLQNIHRYNTKIDFSFNYTYTGNYTLTAPDPSYNLLTFHPHLGTGLEEVAEEQKPAISV